MAITVDTAVLHELSGCAHHISAVVGERATALNNARYSLPSSVVNDNNIGYKLNSARQRIIHTQAKIELIGQFLESAATKYEEAEFKVNNGQPTERGGSEFGKTISMLIGKAGFLGPVFSFMLKPTVNWMDSGIVAPFTPGAKSVLSFMSSSQSTLKTLWSWHGSEKKLDRLARMNPEMAKQVRVKRLFGFDDMFSGRASKFGWSTLGKMNWVEKAMHTDGWTSRFKNNFHKSGNPFKSYTQGGVKSVMAWTGLGLTAASNAYDNWGEYKTGKISKKRAIAETVTETAIDVGSGMLIGTAVAAGVAATIGSAPVLVVGVATIGVSAGLNWASKKITGKLCGEEKGLTEALSDMVLDAPAKFSEKIGKGVSSVKAAFSKLPKLPSGGRRGFKPLFSF